MLDRQKEVKSVSYVDILTKKVYLQPLLITMGVMITQQVRTNVYKEVQLDLTPEIEVFHMLFERCPTKNRKSSLKQHIKCLNCWSKILLDRPLLANMPLEPQVRDTDHVCWSDVLGSCIFALGGADV